MFERETISFSFFFFFFLFGMVVLQTYLNGSIRRKLPILGDYIENLGVFLSQSPAVYEIRLGRVHNRNFTSCYMNFILIGRNWKILSSRNLVIYTTRK